MTSLQYTEMCTILNSVDIQIIRINTKLFNSLAKLHTTGRCYIVTSTSCTDVVIFLKNVYKILSMFVHSVYNHYTIVNNRQLLVGLAMADIQALSIYRPYLIFQELAILQMELVSWLDRK